MHRKKECDRNAFGIQNANTRNKAVFCVPVTVFSPELKSVIISISRIDQKPTRSWAQAISHLAHEHTHGKESYHKVEAHAYTYQSGGYC